MPDRAKVPADGGDVMTDIRIPDDAERAAPRIHLLDMARGVALVAMAVFHSAWDMAFLGLANIDPANDPGWKWFARLIAASFLAITGASLVLATRERLDWPLQLRRVGKIAAAAALVTLATYVALPRNYVWFGILHHIALASLIALPLTRAPLVVPAVLAGLAFALPHLVSHPLLDEWWMHWLGLNRYVLPTVDYIPLLPWLGCVLAGLVAMRIALARPPGWLTAAPGDSIGRGLVWLGRRSLAVYLIHQPVLIAFFWALSLVLVPTPPVLTQDDGFKAACIQACRTQGTPAPICESACGCTIAGLKSENLWPDVLADRLTPLQTERASAIALQCTREARNPPPP
jgi:uncharacterized membrane protein